MNTNYLESNHLVLVGKVASEKRYSHEIYGEKFYIFNLEVLRLSSTVDIIPITVSERLLTGINLQLDTNLKVEGQFRSYNNYENEKNRLILTVFAKEIMEFNTEDNPEEISNEVQLTGYICKKPIYRQTPFGREIADILLAVNRAYNKSDYIPCIAWGRNARFCENMDIGTEVKLIGRVQSRMYEKKHEDGSVEERVAYEVSIASLEIIENDYEDSNINEASEEVV